jgi:glycerophosphoryl diester phosphodiesterase
MARPRLSAHRGGPEGLYAPNSLEAIRESLKLGVDLIEFDVRTSSDGHFLTYHNAWVLFGGERTLIEDLPLAAILESAPDAALIKDVLELIKGRAMGHVDLKDSRLEVEVCDLCESVLGAESFVLTTLEDASVRRLRDARPHILVALSLGRDAAGMSKIDVVRLRLSEIFPGRRVRECGANMLALNYQIARLGALSWARRHKIDVLVWTINDEARIKRIVNDERYWGFTTDYPRLALRLRGE